MNDDVKVSIIMPVLNGMPYFERAMDSVLRQSLKEIEIIVVDACSTDGTVEYVEKRMLSDDRISLIKSDKKSHGKQCNLGIMSVKGKYLGFVESDDYISENMYEELYKTARDNGFPECVNSDYQIFCNENGENEVFMEYETLLADAKGSYEKIISLSEMPELIFRDVTMWNGIYKTAFIRSHSIMLNETPGASFQDIGFNLQVHLFAKSQIYIDKPLYHYRRDNPDASSHKKTTSFVVHEFEYILDIIVHAADIKFEFINQVFIRLFGLLTGVLGREYDQSNISDVKPELVKFRNKLDVFMEKIPEWQRRNLLADRMLYAFMNDIETYISMAILINEAMDDEISSMRKAITDVPDGSFVIFGASEVGKSTYAMLKCNAVNRDVMFCDNSRERQGKQIMKATVYSVEDAVKKGDVAAFLVPSGNHSIRMISQLRELGVDDSKIIQTPETRPLTFMFMTL